MIICCVTDEKIKPRLIDLLIEIRYCWKEAMSNLKKEDLVILKDLEGKGRKEFPKATIEEMYTGENGYCLYVEDRTIPWSSALSRSSINSASRRFFN